MKRLLLALALVVALATMLSCNVNDYCLNCATNGDGGPGGDGGDGDANDGGDGDAGDGGPCINTGPEVCDGDDNDCDGMTDELPLPEVGSQCQNQTGACAGSVKQCVNGAITCSVNPVGELCDLIDNDCDGNVDQGNPGGGAKCGTDFGECVAGTLRCRNGAVVCEDAIGGTMAPFGTPEICDGKDNDCDNMLDDGLGALGSCGGGPGPDPNEGLCAQGTLMCVGGGTVCMGDTGPAFEACDNMDNDCDAAVDEDTDKLNDPQNCNGCGIVCDLPNAFEGCSGGNCNIAACQPQFHNNNGVTSDGCEFGPCTKQGNEVCNGIDDDCNPATNENTLPPPPSFCLTLGECAGATASCQGVNGFRCNYTTDVSTDANGNVIAETLCDGLDNDCDGQVDENQPNLGDACTDSGVGECQGSGTFQCNPANLNGAAICVITDPGSAMTAEICDGKDNDCNGVVDNGANTGDIAGQEWVTIAGTTPTIEIMKYEASRPDATATAVGASSAFACSRQNVQPWTNITHPQAETACASIGARLCSELEWQKSCDPAPSYPIAGPPNATDFVVVEVESAFAIASGSGHNWAFLQPPTQLQDFSGIGAMEAQPVAGNNTVTQANAAANAPRLGFQFDLLASTTYFVWVRMLSANANDNQVHVGLGTTANPAATSSLNAPTNNVWTWVRSAALMSSGTAGNHIVAVYMGEDGVRIDAIAITRDTTTTAPLFDERTWSYSTNPKIPQAQVCNGDDFDTTPGGTDQDAILATGSRPQCFGNGSGANDAFDMSGNVKEWTQERAANQNPLRGGASNNEVDGLTCGLNFTLADDQFFFPNVGFRCCRLQ